MITQIENLYKSTNAIKNYECVNANIYNSCKRMLNNHLKYYSKQLKAFPKNKMGLTLDHVKFSNEYQETKQCYSVLFAKLRKLNQANLKKFKNA